MSDTAAESFEETSGQPEGVSETENANSVTLKLGATGNYDDTVILDGVTNPLRISVRYQPPTSEYNEGYYFFMGRHANTTITGEVRRENSWTGFRLSLPVGGSESANFKGLKITAEHSKKEGRDFIRLTAESLEKIAAEAAEQ